MTIRVADGSSWQGAIARPLLSGAWSNELRRPAIEVAGFYQASTYNPNIGATLIAGVQVGDVCVVSTANRFNKPVTAPAGWVAIDTVSQGLKVIVSAWYHVIDGSETWPQVFTSTLSTGSGLVMTQTLLRNVNLATPIVFQRNTIKGYVSKAIGTGRIPATIAGSYLINLVAHDSIRTVETPSPMKLLSSLKMTAAGVQLDTSGKSLLEGVAAGYEVRYNQVIETTASLTVVFAPA